MNHIYLTCDTLPDAKALHRVLAAILHFPEYYGHNLDALYDCLGDLEESVHLHLMGWEELPDWKNGFASVFDDAQRDFDHFAVTYE